MAAHFCVLASGSSGNASLLSCNAFGLLIDAGLGPRTLGYRLAAFGSRWENIHAALLTHVHGDHWNQRTFSHFVQRKIPVYCHEEHEAFLCSTSRAFEELQSCGLVRHYHLGSEFTVADGFQCRPLPVSHDGGITCGFRFSGSGWAVGYATDLGTWDQELSTALANVDVLAIEFNHDVEMEIRSGRSALLIGRVLGELGHLSNEQAARLVAHVLRNSEAGRLQHVVQLHLSRDCNRPNLAREAVMSVLPEAGDVRVHTAKQNEPGPSLWIREREPVKPREVALQAWLPGWES